MLARLQVSTITALTSASATSVAVDKGLRAEAPDAPAIAHFLNVVMDGIAGHDGAAEPGLVDGHEIDERRLLELLEMAHAERAGGLRHALDEEHAGHDGIAGEVALEIGLVRRSRS